MGTDYLRIQSSVDVQTGQQLSADDIDVDIALSNLGRLNDQQLFLYMLKNDIALQSSLDCYRNNYVDCLVEMVEPRKQGNPSKVAVEKDEEAEELARRMLEYLQNFLFDVTTSYLVLGFVVFRFCPMPLYPQKLVPVCIPIGDIEWTYEGTEEDQELLRIPDIDVPRHFSQEDTRYYVYKFRSTGQYFSNDDRGVLCRLTRSYRRLVHARDYDLIIRNETLRKTVFVEQTMKADVNVLNQGTRASEYGELQAIMDYTRTRKETTHSVSVPTQHDELRASITNQHHKDTAAPDIEFIVLPPNTQAKHITGSYGTVDVQYHKSVYEDEICAILHTPPLGGAGGASSSFVQTSAGSNLKPGAPPTASSGNSGDSVKRSMLFCRKLRHMNAEFQVLLSTVDIFCNSPDTARNITAYITERGERTSHSSIRYKRQKRLQRTRKDEVIPIQLVTGYHSRNNCVVTANSMSSIIMCNELRNVLPSVCFLDFIMKSVDCPQSVKDCMKCVEAQEDRNIALGKEPSGAEKKKV